MRARGKGGQVVESAGRRAGLLAVFRHGGYRRLWLARTVSQWGDVVNFVALALLVFDLTGSGLGVSGVVVAEILRVLWPRGVRRAGFAAAA